MIDWRIYLITDRKIVSDLYGTVEKALRGGIKAIQLREKDLSGKELTELAEVMLRLTRNYNADLFINDRVDIAMATGAKGVHLGVNSVPVRVVRKIAPQLMIGVSTHSLDEALRAEEDGADFITFGPVFETPSKLPYGMPKGTSALEEVTSRLRIPVFAIGGIDIDRIDEVFDAGAYGIALIRAVMLSDDPQKYVEELIEKIKLRFRSD